MRVAAELDAAGAIVARFAYMNGFSPDYMRKGAALYRFIKDHVGSIRLVVDAQTGAIAQELDYDEFGVVRLDTNPGFQPFGFGGGLYDQDTSLVRFGARDYDPYTGRWTVKDPARFGGLQHNLYSYVDGDPINFIDPIGLLKLPPDPTQLPPEWTLDPTHRDPNGLRYRHPSGDVLDFHKGRPFKPGWRGKDHYHHNGGDEHLTPGDEVPDPAPVCKDSTDPPVPEDPPVHPYQAIDEYFENNFLIPFFQCPWGTPVPVPVPVPAPVF